MLHHFLSYCVSRIAFDTPTKEEMFSDQATLQGEICIPEEHFDIDILRDKMLAHMTKVAHMLPTPEWAK